MYTSDASPFLDVKKRVGESVYNSRGITRNDKAALRRLAWRNMGRRPEVRPRGMNKSGELWQLF